MSATPRRAGVAFAVGLLALLLAACGGSRFGEDQQGLTGDRVLDTLPARPGVGGTTGLATTGSAPSTTLKVPVPSTTTTKPNGSGPRAPTTATTVVSRAPVTPAPPTTKVRSPELQRWCPNAAKGLQVFIQADKLQPATYDSALQVVLEVRDTAPSAVRPDMDLVATASQTLIEGLKSGALPQQSITDTAAVRSYLDGKQGVGAYDQVVSALRRVLAYGGKNC